MNCMKSLTPHNYLNNQLLVREQKLMKKKPHITFYLLSKTLRDVRLNAKALTIGAHIEAIIAGSLVSIFLGT